jgi:predicted PurR-regulated permease PerM
MADQSSTPAIVTSSVGPTMQEPVASDPKTKASMVSAEMRRPQVTFKTVVVVAFAILLVGATVWVVVTAHFAVALTGLALLSAVALDHIVKQLERWKVKRWLAIIAVILCLIGVASALALLIIPAAVTQATSLIKSSPQLLDSVRESRIFHAIDRVFHVQAELDNPSRKLAQIAKSEMTPLLSLVGGVLTVVSGVVVISFLTIFMLVFGGPLIAAILREARADRRPMYQSVIRRLHDALGGYMIGLAVICSINATVTTIFLAVNHTPFFLPLGLLCGISSVIPYAGPIASGITVSAVVFGTGGVGHGIAAVIYFILYGQLEGNVLGPLVFRRAVHVNPLLVTLSVLFFGELGGILGAVAAVPLLAVVQILVGEILQLRRAGLTSNQERHADSELATKASNSR